jgi:hypothetical protein
LSLKKFDEAKKQYDLAIAQSPGNSYVKQKMTELIAAKNVAIKQSSTTTTKETKPVIEEVKPKEKDFTAVRLLIKSVESRSKFFDYQVSKDIADIYPEGVSQEKLDTYSGASGSSNVTRRIVVANGLANVYAQFTTAKGIRYTKNGLPATDYIWQKETEDPGLLKNY